MTEKSEALRLADALIHRHGAESFEGDAAAELRRLHSKVVDLEESVRILLTVVSERDRIEAQRDALLKLVGKNERFTGGVWDRARAAIKQAEENT